MQAQHGPRGRSGSCGMRELPDERVCVCAWERLRAPRCGVHARTWVRGMRDACVRARPVCVCVGALARVRGCARAWVHGASWRAHPDCFRHRERAPSHLQLRCKTGRMVFAHVDRGNPCYLLRSSGCKCPTPTLKACWLWLMPRICIVCARAVQQCVPPY